MRNGEEDEEKEEYLGSREDGQCETSKQKRDSHDCSARGDVDVDVWACVVVGSEKALEARGGGRFHKEGVSPPFSSLPPPCTPSLPTPSSSSSSTFPLSPIPSHRISYLPVFDSGTTSSNYPPPPLSTICAGHPLTA